jgi:DnaJ-class molecular chaperone
VRLRGSFLKPFGTLKKRPRRGMSVGAGVWGVRFFSQGRDGGVSPEAMYRHFPARFVPSDARYRQRRSAISHDHFGGGAVRDQSRALKVGDRVRWEAATSDLGTVTSNGWGGVVIEWNDGRTSSIHQNDNAAGRERSGEFGLKQLFQKAYFMKMPIRRVTEIKCPACDGTGLPKVRQPTEPGRRIFPAPCKECLGKGRVSLPRP